MGAPDYEAIGRYTVLCERAQQVLAQRNTLMERAAHALTVRARTQLVPRPTGAEVSTAARKTPVEAVMPLLDQVCAADAELVEALAQIDELAPLVDRPALLVVSRSGA